MKAYMQLDDQFFFFGQGSSKNMHQYSGIWKERELKRRERVKWMEKQSKTKQYTTRVNHKKDQIKL